MDKIILERSPLADVTLISNLFLDEYMPHANGEYVKVYLYILRCSTRTDISLSVCTIADALERTEADITRALKYWEQLGLLGLEFDKTGSSLIKIVIKDLRKDMPITFKLVPETTTVAAETESQATASEPEIPEKRDFSTSELNKLTSDEDIMELLYISQTYLGKTFSPAETNTILYFYDGLGFPVELIEYLIEYCVSNGHKSMRYIEKVALNWAKENIDSVEAAKARVAAYNNNCYPVLQAFGLQGRNPASSERAFIVKWTDEYGFSMDMILDACNRTINTIHQPSFQYADSILQRWLKNGIKTPADVKSIDMIHETKARESIAAKAKAKTSSVTTNSFNNFSTQREYDYAALEKDLLRRR